MLDNGGLVQFSVILVADSSGYAHTLFSFHQINFYNAV